MKLISIPEKYRPSKKFIISISILAGVAVLFVGIRYLAQHSKSSNPLNKVKVGELQNPADSDFDKDGLKDWEEALWGTNANNPDTDANGVPDGRQIEMLRANINQQQGTDVAIPPEQLTETDKLARDIYTSLVIASQASPTGEISEADSQILQKKIIEYILVRTGGFEQYQESDLTITANTDQYVGAYLKFVTAPDPEFQQAQTQLFQTISELSNNTITPEAVSVLGGQYLDFAEKIKKQPVPQKFVQAHLMLGNSFLQIGSILKGVAVIENDPLTAFVNAIALQDAINTMADAFGVLGDVLAQP